MKAILTKDECLAAIGERPAEVRDDSKWVETDENAIANLYLTLADGVLSSIEGKKNYLVFDDVVAAILEKENRRNNREDRQTSSRQVEALVVMRGRSMEPSASGSHNHALHKMVMLFVVKQQLQMKKRRDLQIFNDHERKIIEIGSIMMKMYDGTVRTIRDVQNVEGLKKNLLSLGQLDDLGSKGRDYRGGGSIESHNSSHRVAVTWYHKLGHMLKQGMKILVERKLLPSLKKFNPWEEQSILYPSSMISGVVGCTQSRRSLIYLMFLKFTKRVELDSGKKIKCLRTDNRGEYTGEQNLVGKSKSNVGNCKLGKIVLGRNNQYHKLRMSLLAAADQSGGDMWHRGMAAND
uniref:Retrovirus-related Pol polyprotein from transposon TNT 1-94-like beta-barrel domain-containing protein n=1 Tax=Tanacetum cinerariifolium TaxID=118510 RepID=A0A699JG14_TANCI|nr:hypothetical protein [Tanacetum cinerariifolium]